MENPGDAAMALVLAAAVVLAVAAGLCASAEIALFRMVRAGGRERARDGSNGNSSAVQAILAEPRRYLSVLLAIRMGTETAAVVFATAALVTLLGTGWHTFLIALAGMVVIHMTVGKVAIRPRLVGKAATVLQMALVLWVLLQWDPTWLRALILAAAICTGISGLLYVWDGVRQLSAHPSSSPEAKA